MSHQSVRYNQCNEDNERIATNYKISNDNQIIFIPYSASCIRALVLGHGHTVFCLCDRHGKISNPK